MSHVFICCVFIFIYFKLFFWFLLWWLFRSIFLSFQIFRAFPYVFIIDFCYLFYFRVTWTFFKLVEICFEIQNIVCLAKCTMCSWVECAFCYRWSILAMIINQDWSTVKVCVLTGLCLLVISVIRRRIHKSPSIVVG